MTITTYDEKNQVHQPAYPSEMEKATIAHVEGVEDKGYVSRTDELAVGERHEKVSEFAEVPRHAPLTLTCPPAQC